MMRETLLYVDDEELNLELFKANFEDDYEVLIADSGQEGLDILSSRDDISVIVSDVKMPGMNGFEFIQKVKSTKPDKVCIILSAYRETDFINPGITKKDIYSYMNKPWRRQDMSKVLVEAIEEYNSLQEV